MSFIVVLLFLSQASAQWIRLCNGTETFITGRHIALASCDYDQPFYCAGTEDQATLHCHSSNVYNEVDHFTDSDFQARLDSFSSMFLNISEDHVISIITAGGDSPEPLCVDMINFNKLIRGFCVQPGNSLHDSVSLSYGNCDSDTNPAWQTLREYGRLWLGENSSSLCHSYILSPGSGSTDKEAALSPNCITDNDYYAFYEEDPAEFYQELFQNKL